MKNQKSTGLLRAISKTAKFVGLHVHDRFMAEGIELTRPQFVLLKILSEKDGRSQNDLAFITERDKTSMARLANSMEKKGLVIRKPDDKDLRKKILFLTDEGRKLLDEAWPIMEEIEKNLSKQINPEDIKTTLSVINKIQSKVLSTNGVKL